MDYNANITPAKLTMNGSNSNTPRSSLNTPGSSRKRTKGNMFQAFDTACKGISSRADLINKQEIYTNIKSNDGFAVFINQVNSYYGTSERGKIAKDKFITQTFDKFIGKFTADSDEGIKLKEVRNKLDVAASITSSVSASPTTFVGVFQSKGLSNLPTPPKAGSPFPTVEGIPRIVGTPTSSQTRKVVAVTSVSRSKAVPVQAVIASSNPTISNVGSTSRKQAVPALIKPPTPPTALETFREQYDE
ncbi:MAG: hypothetical protein HOM96_05010, partial [Rickettsiales bacterium]|nr:hypothetical protein [Rickettsiales bacterium]